MAALQGYHWHSEALHNVKRRLDVYFPSGQELTFILQDRINPQIGKQREEKGSQTSFQSTWTGIEISSSRNLSFSPFVDEDGVECG